MNFIYVGEEPSRDKGVFPAIAEALAEFGGLREARTREELLDLTAEGADAVFFNTRGQGPALALLKEIRRHEKTRADGQTERAMLAVMLCENDKTAKNLNRFAMEHDVFIAKPISSSILKSLFNISLSADF